jgi:hypothetical protein
MSILQTPLPEGGWKNDTCIFGPIYGFIQKMLFYIKKTKKTGEQLANT